MSAKKSGMLDDFVTFPEFAEEVDRCERTVDRWTQGPDGLPFSWMGSIKVIHIPSGREWLLNRMRRRNQRRHHHHHHQQQR
jgi:hypothetical protein